MSGLHSKTSINHHARLTNDIMLMNDVSAANTYHLFERLFVSMKCTIIINTNDANNRKDKEGSGEEIAK